MLQKDINKDSCDSGSEGKTFWTFENSSLFKINGMKADSRSSCEANKTKHSKAVH